jgi:hypothetical protein
LASWPSLRKIPIPKGRFLAIDRVLSKGLTLRGSTADQPRASTLI